MTAKQLRQALRRLGWNQSVLAREVGVSEATISRWANGKCRIPELLPLFMSVALRTKRREAKNA